jgi:hypothetical protein
VFSLKLTARPDARMVEVPLEIEAELPREFDGAALLASSGLPRRVHLRAAKDALKLSTAYRADRLVGDIVRGSLRGTAADVQRVQDAVMKFVRAVRERRQDGATLVVTSNGRGKIEVVEVPGSRPPVPSAPLQPYETPRPPTTQERAAPDRVSLLERRVGELEAALSRLGGGELVERLAQVEQKLAPAMAQVSRALSAAEIAGPGQENSSSAPGARSPAPRRVTALDSYADGLRGELRSRASAAAERVRAEAERCDRAAALAADAEQLGATQDGTAQQLREAAAQVAARQTALQRLAEEIEFYPGPELSMAGQLLARLEEPASRDPAPLLQPKAEAIVRGAKGEDGGSRTSWLQRAATLCGWQLVAPSPGDAVQPGWHQAIDSGGDTVVALICPGLKLADGTPIVEARVTVDLRSGEDVTKRLSYPPPRLAVVEEPAEASEPVPAAEAVEPVRAAEAVEPVPAAEAVEPVRAAEAVEPAPAAEAPAPTSAVETLATAVAAAPEPAPAVPVQPVHAAAPPDMRPQPFALLPPASSASLLESIGNGETSIAGEEAAAAALAAAHAVRIVADDPAANDEALAAQVAAMVASPEFGIEHVDGDLVDGAAADRATETPKTDG